MSSFYVVECGCGNKLTVYSNSTKAVSCPKCGTQIAVPSGGRVKIVNGRVLEASK
jgi:ribosomal protein S27E